MDRLIISTLASAVDPVEIVERKGLGHPDTICDALAEALSRNLCRAYQQRFGEVLHHNVDKALLCGGSAAPAFRGGMVLAPIDIHLAGRAVSEVDGQVIPVIDIAIEGSRAWIKENLHAIDPDQHVRIYPHIRPGSKDLQELFARGPRAAPLANDTSIGVGHAPLSRLEQLVLAIERRINGRDRERERPAWGEDVKVLAIRQGQKVELTVACAMIGRYLNGTHDYLEHKTALARLVRKIALEYGFENCDLGINVADDLAAGSLYLTVTGTSAEAGDDGQVGRGNRVNGLITPSKPMSLEAAAGKNPVSHVGKIYNVLAQDIAETLVAMLPEIAEAHCLMVATIGRPVTDPAIVQVKVATREGIPVIALKPRMEEIIRARIARVPRLVDDFMAGAITVF